MPARIYRVVDLHVLIVGEGADRRAIIEAIGFTATPGWSDIRLHSLEKKLSPDGILDIEFVGEPPAKPVPQVVPKFPVTGCLVCEKDVERLVGVRIVARSNELSRLLGQTVQRGGLGVMPGPGGAGDGGPPIITFEEGETMPTLGEDNPTEAEEPPITFEDGEEMPTLGETDPTQAETGPTKWEDIPTSDEENPTAQEETPTGQETTPTFREWEATQWEDFPTLPAAGRRACRVGASDRGPRLSSVHGPAGSARRAPQPTPSRAQKAMPPRCRRSVAASCRRRRRAFVSAALAV